MGKVLGALAAIVVFGVIGYGLWLGYQAVTQHDHQAQASTNATAVAGETASHTAIVHDAVQAVQGEATSEAQIRAQTQASTNAIESAPGAEVPVAPSLYDAALRAHCLRNSSRGEPACRGLRIRGS